MYWISGDSVVNSDIARLRSIPFLLTRDDDGNALKKSVLIEKICKEKKYDLKNTWFIGDDFFDMSAIKICGQTFCPNNSFEAIKNEVNVVIPRMSGQYLAAWLVDYLVKELNLDYPTEEEIGNKEREENQKY